MNGTGYPTESLNNDVIDFLAYEYYNGFHQTPNDVPSVWQFRIKEGVTPSATQEDICSKLWYCCYHPNGYMFLHNGTNTSYLQYSEGGTSNNVACNWGSPTYLGPCTSTGGTEPNRWMRYEYYGKQSTEAANLWGNLSIAEGEQLVGRKVTAMFENNVWAPPYLTNHQEDDRNSIFKHSYIFKVDLPNLDTDSQAGKIQLYFGTGAPFSKYPTWDEAVSINWTDLRYTILNQGVSENE